MPMSILHVLSTAAAILAVLAPFPDFWRIYKTRSTGSVSVLPVVLIFCNCYAWVMYARRVNSIPQLFVAYAVGMLASIAFGGIYYHWTRDHAHIHKLYGAAFYLLAGYTLYYSLGTSGATNQSNEEVANTLGAVSGLINLALYASPLEGIQNVVETKDASTFPITLSALFLVNGVIWVLYSIAQDDMLVLVPNELGVVLCVVQVGLYVVYKSCNSSTDIQLVDESYTLRETLTDPETQEYSRTAVLQQ